MCVSAVPDTFASGPNNAVSAASFTGANFDHTGSASRGNSTQRCV